MTIHLRNIEENPACGESSGVTLPAKMQEHVTCNSCKAIIKKESKQQRRKKILEFPVVTFNKATGKILGSSDKSLVNKILKPLSAIN